MLLSARAYARERGVSHTAVQKAIKSGRISVDPEGKIDPDIADKEWSQNTRTTRSSMNTDEVTDRSGAYHIEPSDFNKARTVRETYKARIAKLDYEERSGKLVNADEVKIAAFNSARKLRDRVLQLPRRLSAQLAAETDAREVESILTKAIREALEELSKENNE